MSDQMDITENIDIVIVGAGICGLATALGLHRKGITSVVLERSKTLRASGGAVGILANGWRALDQLGVGLKLIQTASFPIHRVRDIWLDSKKQRESPASSGEGEAWTVKRSDLINLLAEDLPPSTIRLGCHAVSLKFDHNTSYPILQLHDGRNIKAKVLIGCDGANSVVAKLLKLKPKKIYSMCVVRGFTPYPKGHGFASEFLRIHGDKVECGRLPVNQNLVFWFVELPKYPKDSNIAKDPASIKKLIEDSVTGFPEVIVEMIKESEVSSLILTRLSYRTPLDLMLGSFRNGTVTVAGDAMHVMGPFLGQGSSAAMEDAVVLARCLAQKIHESKLLASESKEKKKMEEAIDEYVRERRIRLVKLSAQTCLIGMLLGNSSSIVKLLSIFLMAVLFRDPLRHTRYDCGVL